jgi:hypothetical protein
MGANCSTHAGPELYTQFLLVNINRLNDLDDQNMDQRCENQGPVPASGRPARYYIVKNDSHNFLDITPCSSVRVKRSFEEAHRLHVQGIRVSQRINGHEAVSNQKAASCWFVSGSTQEFNKDISNKTPWL